ncbi:MAG: helix-turn-helix domain-containing protein [Anaeromyxobacter sp.]
MPNASPRDHRRAREIERTRQDILEAAARVFADGGYHAATMQAIAREAGFTAASLYTYFDSKEAIYTGLCEEMEGRILEAWDLRVPAGLTFPQRLELVSQRVFVLLLEHKDALRVIFDMGPPRVRAARGGPARFLERSAKFITEHAGDELRLPSEEAALVLFGLSNALIIPWLLGKAPLDPAAHAAHLVDLFLRGAGRPAAT